MERRTRTTRRVGVTRRGERIFTAGASAFIMLLALGWVWSIASAATDRGDSGRAAAVTDVGAAITSSLSDPQAKSAAYLTDAALAAVTPLRGESGKLRAIIRAPGEELPDDTLAGGAVPTIPGASAPPKVPGIWQLALRIGNAIRPLTDFSVITLRPAADKRNGKIGLYYIGNWPSMSSRRLPVTYVPPRGFIEVTPENQDTRLSDHFEVRDFLTKGQANVWPKYLVVDTKLVDKLELVLSDLAAQGIPSKGVYVMSGFRTPQYNAGGGNRRGRASLSRHMYGDAADIWIDNDGDGQMDDLNRDGRVNIADARVILAAVERVERAHPSLIGGCGVYVATSAHGPFTHIDTRGYKARWTGTGDG
jgi:hypothetical protein